MKSSVRSRISGCSILLLCGSVTGPSISKIASSIRFLLAGDPSAECTSGQPRICAGTRFPAGPRYHPLLAVKALGGGRMKDHDGSVALVTGGSSGIGRAVAELLAAG